MRTRKHLARIGLVALVFATGACMEDESGGSYASPSKWEARRIVLPAGTSFDVRLASRLHSQIAGPGDSWTGVLASPVVVDGQTRIPKGSSVHGTVRASRKPSHSDGAMLDLSVRSVWMDGKEYRLDATTEQVVADAAHAIVMTAAASTPEPLVLKPGAILTFTIDEPVAVGYPQ